MAAQLIELIGPVGNSDDLHHLRLVFWFKELETPNLRFETIHLDSHDPVTDEQVTVLDNPVIVLLLELEGV